MQIDEINDLKTCWNTHGQRGSRVDGDDESKP